MVRLRCMALGVLGPLLPNHITRPAQRRLLSILLLRQGSDLDRDLLIDCMWGNEPPRSARNALQVHINGLRRAIPDDVIATTTHGYRIVPDGHGFDVSDFDRLAVAAHNVDDPSERLRFIARALKLWRGNPYQELTEDAFALPEIVRLKERRLELAELHMQTLLQLGHNGEAIPQLRELVERFPLSEHLHEDLMLALYRSGRQAEALRQFQSARRVLGEIGIEPGSALKELEERILLQDPDLGITNAQPTPHNLPTFTTSFVGHDEETASAVEALSASRLVSIVGGPSFGETRLAAELGHPSLQDHPGGVW
ncbi:MAG: BTAD domain-containing putative transcriptional regulator, partial [Acidimicrobiia bacterium]